MAASGTLLANNGIGMAGAGTLQSQTSGSPTPLSGASGNRFVSLGSSGYLATAILTSDQTYALVVVPSQGKGTPQAPIPLPNLQGGKDQSDYFLTMYGDPSEDVVYITIGVPSSLWVYKYSVNVTTNSVTLINSIQPMSNTTLGGASQAFQDVNVLPNLSIGLGISQLGVNGSTNTSYILGYLYNPKLGTTDPMDMITPQNNIVFNQQLTTSLATVCNVIQVSDKVYFLWGDLEYGYQLFQVTNNGTTITVTNVASFNSPSSTMYGYWQYQPVALNVTTDNNQYIFITKAYKNASGSYELNIAKFDCNSNTVVNTWDSMGFSTSQVAFISSVFTDGSLWVAFETLNNDSGDVQLANFDAGNGTQIGTTSFVSSQDGTASWSPKLGLIDNLLYCAYVYTGQSAYYQPTSIYFSMVHQGTQLPLKASTVVRTNFTESYLSNNYHLSSMSTVVHSYSSSMLSRVMASFVVVNVVKSTSRANLYVQSSVANTQGVVDIINLHGWFATNKSLKGSV